MRAILTGLAALLVIGVAQAAHTPEAHAALRGIDGKCGVHLGKIVQRNQSGTIYHARVGPKPSNPGGRHRCHGRVKVRPHGSTIGAPQWRPFSLPSFDWVGIVDVSSQGAQTAGFCSSFAAALLIELPSGGLSTVITVGSAAGCGRAVVQLGGRVTNDYAFLRR